MEFRARGFPFTQTQGFYPLINFEDGINSDYLTENADLGILYADINQAKITLLPPIRHRSRKKNIKSAKTVPSTGTWV